jgi:hypothetical protein
MQLQNIPLHVSTQDSDVFPPTDLPSTNGGGSQRWRCFAEH